MDSTEVCIVPTLSCHVSVSGFNNIINWVPEAEMRFDVYPVQQAYSKINYNFWISVFSQAEVYNQL